MNKDDSQRINKHKSERKKGKTDIKKINSLWNNKKPESNKTRGITKVNAKK